MEEAIAKATEEIIEKFEEQWKPAMENLQEAESVFDDLDGEHILIMTACSFTSAYSADLRCKQGLSLEQRCPSPGLAWPLNCLMDQVVCHHCLRLFLCTGKPAAFGIGAVWFGLF